MALSLMMFGPFFLMMGAVGITQRLSFDMMRFDGFGRFTLLNAGEKKFMAEFNALVNDNPKALADTRRLAELDFAFGNDAHDSWSILRDGVELYRSGGSDAGESRWMAPWRRWMGDHTDSSPDLTWKFRFPDGSAGTLLLSRSSFLGFPPKSMALIAMFFVVLIAVNGFLGWWISSGVIRPLARLRDAALRIGNGDLDFSLAPAGVDEFGQVTTAFETMRTKLRASLSRQLEEEAARKELIAHVSHDLRTPINLIRGYAEGLRDGVASTPEMRARYLDVILERAGELEKLIETLFSFSKLDLDGVKPKLTPVDIVPFLDGLRKSFSATFPGARIELAAPESGLRIQADAELTRRAVSNLVENAVTHGGKPEINLLWRIWRSAGMVELSVSDDGAGAAPEDLPRLFEPFFRGDRARTRGSGGPGAGLGLSIVKKIMSVQGGSVRAAASPSGGLEVTLSFREAGGA
jgi:signal transduction histidine kinase